MQEGTAPREATAARTHLNAYGTTIQPRWKPLKLTIAPVRKLGGKQYLRPFDAGRSKQASQTVADQPGHKVTVLIVFCGGHSALP